MHSGDDLSPVLREQVQEALSENTRLNIQGSGSKAFLGHAVEGELISTRGHHGIIEYEPSELVVTVRSGTRLKDLEALLAEHGQQLPFEPPHFGEDATIGGTIAAGLSGPARPYRGAPRDFTLGTRLINGNADILSFGGQVIKNVAGYDVSRLQAGAFGTLGLLLDLSIKVIPLPQAQRTLSLNCSLHEAIDRFCLYKGQSLPISATAWHEGTAHIRLSGHEQAVQAASQELPGYDNPEGDTFWQDLKEQKLDFFNTDDTLWRLSVAPDAPEIPGARTLIEWGGAQRWLHGSQVDPDNIRHWAAEQGGHATAFRNPGDAPVFHPQPKAMQVLQQRIKDSMDAKGIFNVGRMG